MWRLAPASLPAAPFLLQLTSLRRCPASPVPQGVTFACVNAAAAAEEGGKPGEGGEGGEAAAAAAAAEPAATTKLATFALRIKAPEVLEAFIAAVNAHKAGGKKAEAAADP